MILWSAAIAAIGILFHELAEEGDAPFWWRQVFGKYGPALTCLLLLIQNGVMITTYIASAQEDMPSAFLIEGATNVQLNGVSLIVCFLSYWNVRLCAVLPPLIKRRVAMGARCVSPARGHKRRRACST